MLNSKPKGAYVSCHPVGYIRTPGEESIDRGSVEWFGQAERESFIRRPPIRKQLRVAL